MELCLIVCLPILNLYLSIQSCRFDKNFTGFMKSILFNVLFLFVSTNIYMILFIYSGDNLQISFTRVMMVWASGISVSIPGGALVGLGTFTAILFKPIPRTQISKIKNSQNIFLNPPSFMYIIILCFLFVFVFFTNFWLSFLTATVLGIID